MDGFWRPEMRQCLLFFAHAVTTCTRCAGLRTWVHARVCVRERLCVGYVSKEKIMLIG